MRRRLLTFAIFLLAGAVVNVAVAWAAVHLNDPFGHKGDEVAVVEVGRQCYRYKVVRRIGSRYYVLTRKRPCEAMWRVVESMSLGKMPAWAHVRSEAAGLSAWPTAIVYEAHGWPLRSMAASSYIEQNRYPVGLYGGPGRLHVSLTNRPDLILDHDPVIPSCPIWPGFAVNTLFYAALLWLLIPGPFALRRLVRVRRGLCPKCAYPMGESPVCSECGQALPKARYNANDLSFPGGAPLGWPDG